MFRIYTRWVCVCVVHSMIFFFFVLLQLLSSSPLLLQPRIDSVRVYISCVQVSVTSYAITCWHKMQINKHNERLSIEYPPPVNWRALERTTHIAQQLSREAEISWDTTVITSFNVHLMQADRNSIFINMNMIEYLVIHCFRCRTINVVSSMPPPLKTAVAWCFWIVDWRPIVNNDDWLL